MPERRWDGHPRRKSDFDIDGRIKSEVVLARIDERVNILIEGALNVDRKLEQHEKEDIKQFTNIKVTIAGAAGGLAVLVFLIDHFFH